MNGPWQWVANTLSGDHLPLRSVQSAQKHPHRANWNFISSWKEARRVKFTKQGQNMLLKWKVKSIGVLLSAFFIFFSLTGVQKLYLSGSPSNQNKSCLISFFPWVDSELYRNYLSLSHIYLVNICLWSFIRLLLIDMWFFLQQLFGF